MYGLHLHLGCTGPGWLSAPVECAVLCCGVCSWTALWLPAWLTPPVRAPAVLQVGTTWVLWAIGVCLSPVRHVVWVCGCGEWSLNGACHSQQSLVWGRFRPRGCPKTWWLCFFLHTHLGTYRLLSPAIEGVGWWLPAERLVHAPQATVVKRVRHLCIAC